MGAARTAVFDTVGVGETFDPGVLASLKMKNLLTKARWRASARIRLPK